MFVLDSYNKKVPVKRDFIVSRLAGTEQNTPHIINPYQGENAHTLEQ